MHFAFFHCVGKAAKLIEELCCDSYSFLLHKAKNIFICLDYLRPRKRLCTFV
jgi:hypothetical protein